MQVNRTDLGTSAVPRSLLLSREGAAGRPGETPQPTPATAESVDARHRGVGADGLGRLQSEPAVRAEVVAAARAAVASGEVFSRSAAEAAAEGFLRSIDRFSE